MDAISKEAGISREDGMENIQEARTENILVDGRLLKPDDKIHDLVNVINDNSSSSENKQDREIIVIDGRVYERISEPVDEVHDVVDAVEKDSGRSLHKAGLNDEMIKRISEIAESVAREIVPQIVERVIREEIEKLKR